MNFILEMAIYFWKLETYTVFKEGSLIDNLLCGILFKKKKDITKLEELIFN